jgi:hypothetical protein
MPLHQEGQETPSTLYMGIYSNELSERGEDVQNE